MSLARAIDLKHGRVREFGWQVLLSGLSIMLALGCVIALTILVSGALTKSAAPPNPFGLTLREVGPSSSKLGALVMLLQAQFFDLLATSVKAFRASQGTVWGVASIGFLYGIFHAVGPGHGKAVIAAYVFSHRRGVPCAVGLSLSAALLQAIVAIALVTTMILGFRAASSTIDTAARHVETASFFLIAVIGLVLVWRKAAELRDLTARVGTPQDVETVEIVSRSGSDLRQMLGVVVAAGLRPCTGAILVLVFAFGQGVPAAGAAGALAMATGTAITTGSLAAMSVLARASLNKLRDERTVSRFDVAFLAIELCAAAAIAVFGAVLLSGFLDVRLPAIFD